MFSRLFKPRPQIEAGRALYAAAVAQARQPGFYAAWGVADTPMGRFELYTLHVVLLVLRLKGSSSDSAEIVQELFDAYLEGLDIALREMGVGDLSVGKKMKKLGRAFYGRVKSYEVALAQEGDADLHGLIGRTIYEGVANSDPAPLAAYVRAAAQALVAAPTDALLKATSIPWPKGPTT